MNNTTNRAKKIGSGNNQRDTENPQASGTARPKVPTLLKRPAPDTKTHTVPTKKARGLGYRNLEIL